MEIEEIINTVIQCTGAAVVSPATAESLAACHKNMARIRIPAIPAEYTGFLKGLNGFAWNGIEFYGMDRFADTGYILNDIISVNAGFPHCNPVLEHCVLIGRSDGDVYVFNNANLHYAILDMTGRDVMEEFDTFHAMFEDVVLSRIRPLRI